MPGPGTWSAGDILTAADLNAIGTWTTYTPVLDQAGTRSVTINSAKYCVINKFGVANVDLTCTTAGSAGNKITVTMPFNVNSVVGTGFFYDDSLTDVRLLSVGRDASDTVEFFVEESTNLVGFGSNPSLALASNDIISFLVMFEVA